MKVIFLDFDGVLQIEDFSDPWPGQTQRLDGYTDRDRFGLLFDNACVTRLQRLVEATRAGVVINSAWRYSGLPAMQALWQERGMPGVLLGVTSHDGNMDPVSFDPLSKGYPVQRWLDVYPAEHYVIIDDTDDFLPVQRSRLVLTDYETGFSEADLERALVVLGYASGEEECRVYFFS